MALSKRTLGNLARVGVAAYSAYKGYRGRKSGNRNVRSRRTRRAVRLARRSYIRTSTKRKRTGQAGEWDYSKRNAVYGRKPRKNLRYVNKVISASTERIQFVARFLSTYGGTSGAIPLQNRQNGGVGQVLTPCYLLDVTACNNVVAGAITAGPCMQQPILSDETANAQIQWRNFTAWNWVLQDAPETFTAFDSFPNEHSLLNWANVKFLFYAPTALPTKIQIDLVQFLDDRLVPSAPLGTGANGYGGTAGAAGDTFSTGFWQYMLKQYMYNQIEPMANTYRKYVRYLKRMTLYMDPKETTDTANTRYREVNFFANLNRKLDYRWNANDRVGISIDDTQLLSDAAARTEVHPAKRIFVLVRAISGRSVAAAPEPAIHPSFDFYCRTAHSVMN